MNTSAPLSSDAPFWAQADCDARVTDHNGRTALMHAAESGCAEAVARLLPRSDLQAVDRNGCNALMWAARASRDDGEALRTLLTTGAFDPSARDCGGRTALMWAARSCSLQRGASARRLELLLPLSDPGAVSEAGQTALMQGVRSAEVVALLAPLTDVSVADRKGQIALMLAAHARCPESVALLLPRSDVNAADAQRDTALDLAVECSQGFVLYPEREAGCMAELLSAPGLDSRLAARAVRQLVADARKKLERDGRWDSDAAAWGWAEDYPETAAALDRVLAAMPDDAAGDCVAVRAEALASFGGDRGEILPLTAAYAERQTLREVVESAARLEASQSNEGAAAAVAQDRGLALPAKPRVAARARRI